jgi:2-methylisocitrate lyase-like PEP mutase family enzyme
MRTTAEKRSAFRKLHQQGCFMLPNPWDVGSARMLQQMGFEALASTSSGHAWSIGRPDYAITVEHSIEHLTELCAAVDLPVNADFETGFAEEPEGVAANVLRAVGSGVAGLSIEDRHLDGKTLQERGMAVERVRAAREAIDRSGEDVILVARTEGLLDDPSQVSAAIDRLVAFAEVGADCLYAPGVWKKEDIAAMVRAVAPKPVNVLAMKPDRTMAELAELGVRRISIGGALAAIGWAATMKAAEALKAGSFAPIAERAPGRKLNELFRPFAEGGSR